ncbi:MAG: ribosome small subunit-dependent GTPase A [Balneolaceae bacterium]
MSKMTLEDLGFNSITETTLKNESLDGFELGRVVVEHKERYIVQTIEGAFNAEITGNLRFSAESRSDFPTVGDWVKLSVYDDETAIIVGVLPRFSLLERQEVGKSGQKQPIASNVDVAFIMQAVGHDFNLNRLERYLAICNASSIEAIVLLSKIDLISRTELEKLIQSIQLRQPKITVLAISNETESGYDELTSHLESGTTYCILGSSGVGKSSLSNNLLHSSKMEVNKVSESNNKGRHTTSHRELLMLPQGGVIIDTPGMRELGIANESEGLKETFDQIDSLSIECKFSDCTHTEELGCAVLEALENNTLNLDLFNNYHKLKREQAHFSRTTHERRAKDKKMGKLYKSIIQEKQSRKK